MKAKRLYEMTISELKVEAERYYQAGNTMRAQLCREQITLTYAVVEAFRRSCSQLPQPAAHADQS